MADAEVLMIGFFSVFGLAGAIIFYGAIKGWKPLVDPDDPEEDTPFVNSQVVLKKIIGPKMLRVVTILMGFLFFLIGIYGIITALNMPDDNWAF